MRVPIGYCSLLPWGLHKGADACMPPAIAPAVLRLCIDSLVRYVCCSKAIGHVVFIVCCQRLQHIAWLHMLAVLWQETMQCVSYMLSVDFRFFYASSACIYPENKQLDTEVEGGGLKEKDAWPAQVPFMAFQPVPFSLRIIRADLLPHMHATPGL